jgi:eukaryotic-like serine/threonine-protein kinase
MKLCPKCQKQFPDDANFCPVDAARLAPLEVQAPGQDSLSARFELGAKMGGSRTGAVHRATDKTTGTVCVVKLVGANVVALPGVAQRLERELRQLERVQSAGVAKVIGSGKRADGTTWVAMELVDGAHTLADAITARGPIPAAQAADLIEVIGEALIEAAQVGVVHRDLAPKNVLFAGGDVKLINFSLPVPTNDKVPGVPEFVAPEQVDGRPVDQRSNLYSLGALYYYVLTGQPVFAGSADDVHRQHTSATIRPPSQLGGVAPGSPIEAVILRALDRSPTKRFLTVRQFIDEVGRVGHGEVIELSKPATPAPKRPKSELVSTLMGVAKGGEALAQVINKAAPIASAPTVGAGVPSIAAPAAPIVPAAPVVAAAPHPAHIMQTVVGMPSQLPPSPAASPLGAATQLDQRSPWASPGQAVAAPIVPAPAAPVVPSVVVAAPVLAAPVVANQAAAAGKKKADEGDGGKKGKFRETMWFKKGDLDTQAAIAAAEERARTGKDVSTDKADSLPMDERYKDDGSITRGDKEKYSLRTGGTAMMQALRPEGAGTSMKVSEDELIGEMKGGRKAVMIAIAVGIIAVIAIVLMMVR